MSVAAREAKEGLQQNKFEHIAVAHIVVPENTRVTIDKQNQIDLTSSIEQKGILVPLIVREQEHADGEGQLIKYQLVAGHRRLQAAKLLEFTHVPCIVSHLDDLAADEVNLIENLQRADLHPLDEATAYERLLKQMSARATPIEDIAVHVGKSETYVRQRLRLANLTEPARKLFRSGELTPKAAFLIAREPQQNQPAILKYLKEQRYDVTADALQFDIDRMFHLDLRKAPFDTTDATLNPAMGPCTTCKWRTGNESALFPDVKKGDTCTLPACYVTKTENNIDRVLEANPKAIKLTVNHEYSKKPRGEMAWRGTGGKPCKDVAQGVVIQRESYAPSGKDFPLGALIEVCVNPKCKQHFEQDGYSRGTSTTLTPGEKKKRAENQRSWRIDRLIHFSMVQELRKRPSAADLNDVVEETLADYKFRYRAVLMASAFGLQPEGKTPSQKATHAVELLTKAAGKWDDDECRAFLVATCYTPRYDKDAEGRELMRDCAKDIGIDLKAAEKALDVEKPKKEPKPKPKKKKGDK
jgi:ParB/RepB/Spo0J family partition protein